MELNLLSLRQSPTDIDRLFYQVSPRQHHLPTKFNPATG